MSTLSEAKRLRKAVNTNIIFLKEEESTWDNFEAHVSYQKVTDELEALAKYTSKLKKISHVLGKESNDANSAEQQEIETTLDTISEYETKLERKLRRIRTSPEFISHSDKNNEIGTTEVVEKKANYSLPQMTIPQFYGDPWEWNRFITLFNETVGKTNLPEVAKFTYLLKSLSGDASRAISKFQPTKENYYKALELLEDRFGDKELIISTLNERITQLECRSSSWKDQERLLDDIVALYDQMKSADQPVDNCQMWRIILNKFPRSTQVKVVEDYSVDQNNVGELIYNLQTIVKKGKQVSKLLHPENTYKQQRAQEKEHNNRSGFNREVRYNNDSRKNNVGFGSVQAKPESYTQRKTQWDQPIYPQHQTIPTKRACAFCDNANHRSEHCTEFTPVEARKQVARERSLCYRCLSKGHGSADCTKNWQCSRCQRKHHIALCEGSSQPYEQTANRYQSNGAQRTWNNSKTFEKQNDQQVNMLTVDKQSKQNMTNSKNNQSYVLAGLATSYNNNSRKYENLTIIFDTGANGTYATENVINKLGLQSKYNRNIETQTFGRQEVLKETKRVYALELITKQGKKMTIDVTEKDIILPGAITRPILGDQDKKAIKAMNLTLSETKKSEQRLRKPDIVIGTDQCWQLVDGTTRRLPSGLYVLPTLLGAMISGREELKNNLSSSETICTTISVEPESSDMLDKQLRVENLESMAKEWQQEDDLHKFGGSSRSEKDELDNHIWSQFDKTIQLRDDGYYVQFPWKESKHEVPSNYAIAKKRLNSVIRSYKDDEYVMSNYIKTFEEQLEKRIIEKVDINESIENDFIHYLAHQPVITPNKDTTKVRIVFDASAHFKGSLSLNDAINQGPTILPLIIGMYMRFRTGKIAVVSDIEKAFLQVKLQESQRNATRFLWVKDPTKPLTDDNIVIYRYRCVPFGFNASPFLLGATILYHLKHNAEKGFLDQIMENMYVDNVMVTCNTPEEGENTYKTQKSEFDALSMNIREFGTNNSELRQKFADKDRADNLNPKILGTTWNMLSDEMELIAHIKNEEKITKRIISSQSASVYDPLGLLAPLLLHAKQFQQNLWTDHDWDDKLNEAEIAQWTEISSQINGFTKRIPRSVAEVGSTIDLIICSDANEMVMSTCAYVVSGGQSTLLTSKTKLKGLKSKATIPKMEMNAYNMSTEVAINIFQEMKSKIALKSIILLTDSEIALNWIQSSSLPSKAGVFVERRWRSFRNNCSRLQSEKIDVNVGYINTKDNPADCATRGVTKDEFNNHIWWNGPDSFTKVSQEWPIHTKLTPLSQEANSENTDEVILLTTESTSQSIICWVEAKTLRQLARTMAYVLRFLRQSLRNTSIETKKRLNNINFAMTHSTTQLLGDEIQVAREYIIRVHQIEADISDRRNELKNLDIFKDNKGMWRCGGRLRNSELLNSAKFPIYIDKNSQLARLIVHEEHNTISKIAHHRSSKSTICAIRQNYWIPAIRKLVQTILHKCIECQRYNNAPLPYPTMPDLPTRRVKRSRPFQHCGLDYFGPIEYREDNNDLKAWGFIVTCTVTRMVHLEVVNNMTTISFVSALRRFFGRRGVPQTITCDNAPTFTLGSEVVNKTFQSIEKEDEFTKFVADECIQWIKITPFSPWQGGFYERLIQDIKRCYFKATKRSKLSLDSLKTIFVEIEAIINSRPLTYIDSTTDGSQILRPIDFIQSEVILNLPWANMIEESDDPEYLPENQLRSLQTRNEAINAFNNSRKTSEKYWTIFHKDYLTSLRERHVKQMEQGRRSKLVPHVGMIVLVEDDMQPRRMWNIAKIDKLNVGKDGNIREVEIKLSNQHVIKRSVNKLIPLELHEEVDTNTIPRQQPSNIDHDLPTDHVIIDEPQNDKTKNAGKQDNIRTNNHYNLRNQKKIDYSNFF